MLRLTLSLFALATASDWAAGDEGLNLLQLRAGLATQKVALEHEDTGNDLVARLTPDNAVNIEFVDRGAGPFADAGILTSVRFYVQRPGNKGLRFRIYRPAGGGFTLVGQTEEIEMQASGAIQEVAFSEPVEYEAGDYIGWCHNADGNIPFDIGGGTVSWEYNKNTALGVTRGFGAGGARTYSYELATSPKTTTTPPPPADEAAAEGDPHLTFMNGERRDLEPADLSMISAKVALDKGNDLVARLTPDNAQNIEFVDRGAGPFADAGTLSSVRFYVQRPGNKGLRFRIYRPAGGGFTLVGQTEEIEMQAAGAIQEVAFSEPVDYEAGDYIGWCHNADGNIPFDTSGGRVSWEYHKNNNLGVTRGFGDGGARTYSYEVISAPPTTTPAPEAEAAAVGDPHLSNGDLKTDLCCDGEGKNRVCKPCSK